MARVPAAMRLAVTSLFFLSAGPVHADAAAPDDARLATRVAALHAAMGRKDIDTWYSMMTPSVRARMTLEDFKRDMRWNERGLKAPPAPMQATLGRICSCARVGISARRCVLSVDVAIDDPAKGHVDDKPLEMWEYQRGEWYLGYIGASTAGRCPGEP